MIKKVVSGGHFGKMRTEQLIYCTIENLRVKKNLFLSPEYGKFLFDYLLLSQLEEACVHTKCFIAFVCVCSHKPVITSIQGRSVAVFEQAQGDAHRCVFE